ncbi:MAG: hypothetical protein OFPI_05620 [Osedax symbiont Rs2]|nr:MAG: hypothetical protein OFPI_05620 [Osedax symbiont Rs2]
MMFSVIYDWEELLYNLMLTLGQELFTENYYDFEYWASC